ncbi:MAG: hypothetical protein ACRCZF_10170, partial [Gemmataceae bacterium]
SNVPYTDLPLLDRLNDDSIDLGYRSVNPFLLDYIPGLDYVARELQSSPKFNPQKYAIRRLLDNRIDTRDDVQVLQLGVDQRFQTKRGFAGLEHTVDWLSVNLSASLFPESERDNFGKNVAFLEYNVLWNPGDRTSIQSAGWFDPYDPGTRYWNIGLFLNRPDNTNFFFGYRQIDPVNSTAVMAGVYYPLSRKYAVAANASYDFGIDQAITNTFNLIRVGKDLTLSFGFSYNAIVQNFGVQFSILPNLATGTAYTRGLGTPQFGGR